MPCIQGSSVGVKSEHGARATILVGSVPSNTTHAGWYPGAGTPRPPLEPENGRTNYYQSKKKGKKIQAHDNHRQCKDGGMHGGGMAPRRAGGMVTIKGAMKSEARPPGVVEEPARDEATTWEYQACMGVPSMHGVGG